MKTNAVDVTHEIHECGVTKDSALGVRLFRAPIVNDGSGDHRRLPHEIQWVDLSVGDLVIAVRFATIRDQPEKVIDTLQIWHVVAHSVDEYTIRVNNLVGMAGDGKYVYDQLAGLVGLPPCS